MDLFDLKPSLREIEIKHPVTLEPIGLNIRLRPTSSPEMKDAQRRFSDARLEKGKDIKSKDVDEMKMDFVCESVADWSWSVDLNWRGKKPAPTRENIREVLAELDWLKDQIDIALADTKAFFRKAGTESE